MKPFGRGWSGLRHVLLQLHRYTGLFLAVFLAVEGITGSLSVFREEMDIWLNPDLFITPKVQRNAPVLPFPLLVTKLQQTRPAATLLTLTFHPPAGQNGRAVFMAKDKTGHMEEVFFIPGTGAITGTRPMEGSLWHRHGLIPFLYYIHYSLALGPWGTLCLGVIALVWVGDCMTGLLLTFPPGFRPWCKAFWQRWAVLWRISSVRYSIRFVYDLHRAPALWLWGVLLGMAISGVALALGPPLFEPAVRAVFPSAALTTCPSLFQAGNPLSLGDGLASVTQCVERYGAHSPPAGVMFLSGEQTLLFYRFTADGEDPPGLGSPILSLDRHSGIATFLSRPGAGRMADWVIQLQSPWHSGRLLGLFGRISITVIGIIVTMLSVTGVLISYRKLRQWQRKTGINNCKL